MAKNATTVPIFQSTGVTFPSRSQAANKQRTLKKQSLEPLVEVFGTTGYHLVRGYHLDPLSFSAWPSDGCNFAPTGSNRYSAHTQETPADVPVVDPKQEKILGYHFWRSRRVGKTNKTMGFDLFAL